MADAELVNRERSARHHSKYEGEYVYFGSVSSIMDDTPGGLDDLYAYKVAGLWHLLRAWGNFDTSTSNYRVIAWDPGRPDTRMEFDPYWGVLINILKKRMGAR